MIVALLGLLMLPLPRSYGFPGAVPKTKLVEGTDGSFYGTTELGGKDLQGTVFKMTPKPDGSWKLTTLVEFDAPNNPSGGLLKGSDGNFYGMTFGDSGNIVVEHPKVGTIFKMTPTGVLTTLANFDGVLYGACPSGGLLMGSDGNFYGTTEFDSINNDGTVFRVTPAGVLTQLKRFDRSVPGGDTDGSDPTGGLVRKSDGNFYGTTVKGGANDKGAVFKVSPAGDFAVTTTLVSFDGTNGSSPRAGLTVGLDGNFYGTTETGGMNDKGTVFQMTPAGGLTTLVNFDGTHGSNPRAALVKGTDGNFYGTTENGGTNDKGTVFRMTPAGALTTLASFDGTTNSSHPFAELVEARDGNFYGTTAGDPNTLGDAHPDEGSVFKMTPAGALTKLVDFDDLISGGNVDISAVSLSGAVEGSDGNFYGTTADGGTNDKGTFLQLAPDGASGTTLVNFDGTNGSNPGGDLVKGSDGNFYGTTQGGGTDDLGTVFKVTPAGALTTLASFDGAHGATPTGKLLLASDGNFYGTTSSGGTNDLGTVFKMTPAGALTRLVDFNGTNGSNPDGLLQGTDGNFYGVTMEGGKTYDPGVEDGPGTVFKMTPAGALTTLVDCADTITSANFLNGSVLSLPIGLVQGRDGNFYGFTTFGGSGLYGTVFKMTPAGELTFPVKFAIGNGSYPNGLVQGSDGNLYGTTASGGIGGQVLPGGFVGKGTVFRLTPAGALNTLVNFNVTPGSAPNGVLFFGSDGQLCGVAQTLFRIPLKPGAGPTLTAPTPGTATNGPLHVAFTLPERAQLGSVKLTFTNSLLGVATELTLAQSQETSGAHSFTFDAFNPSASPEIADADAIPELPYPLSVTTPPFYTLSLSYRDMAGNPGPIVTSVDLTIDRTPPAVLPPQDIDVTTTEPVVIVNYDAAQAGDASGPVTLSYSKKSGTFFNAGTTKVTVTAEDRAHNRATTSFKVTVHAPFPGITGVLAQGDAAPGAGTPGGPPDDAVIASFGLPAIDDVGNLAFTAKWTSASSKTKGTGLFFNDTCLALVGGDAGAVAKGAKWKSFTDPVVSEGCVVCIATLTGVKTGTTAIVGNLTGPALVKIARTGEAAAGESVGGATFKSFKAVTVQPTVDVIPRVTFLAQLTPGKGTPKVSATNDVGLWYYEPDYPLFVVREGDAVAGRKIKTLAPFIPGNGSPGQGRGTLVNSMTTGTPLVTALAMFTDGTQGIIWQDLYDGPPALALSLSGDADTGVDDGKTFASYSLPASNSDEVTAFLGTLNGATKADASGIFTGPDMNGKFAKVIRVSDDATAAGAGAKFSLLKDPVLSEDGAIAFPATVSVKGPGAQTLWWKPAGQPLALLAQGGADATELAGSKWTAFTSLAIAGGGRGPIFAATTTPGKGAAGVWATDSTGATRLLFHTGSQIGVDETTKTVKSFTLLKASVGSGGVTRSFNNAAEVVLLATFTDKSQAIVTTEVP